jgi:hypothetical protein
MATTDNTQSGVTVTGNIDYAEGQPYAGDPMDYLYYLLRIIKGPAIAEKFRDKGLSDPEGFAMVQQDLDTEALEAAERANLVNERSLFGTDEQRGSIEIGGESAQKIQDIAQALRDDQALSNIELIEKYGEQAANAIRSLDPDRLEQQSLLQELSRKRMEEAIAFDANKLPAESLMEQTSLDLLTGLRDESVIEKAVKEAALGALDPAFTDEEAIMKKRAAEYLASTGRLSDKEALDIEEGITRGLAKQGRLYGDMALKDVTKARIEAELDKQKTDITFGAGLYGTFENIYGDRQLRGAGLGITAQQLESARLGENRQDIKLANDLTTSLYNYENNRLSQQNVVDSNAAQMQNQYDQQSAQYTGDIFSYLGTTSPYGQGVLNQATTSNVEAQTLNQLISMGSADYTNSQNYAATMEGIADLRSGVQDYSSLIRQGMVGQQQASQSGINPMMPSIYNSFEGYGDLNTGQKLSVIGDTFSEINDIMDTGGISGNPDTNVINDPFGALRNITSRMGG